MPIAKLSLTDFVDIFSTSGTPKATKVRKVKNRPDYNPATDFYKRIREIIIETHEEDNDKSFLDRSLIGLTDHKKQTAYPPILQGYKKWWGKKIPNWFEPPRDHYSKNDIDVIINPELGLEIGGTHYLIKLYFKTEQLTKSRAEIIAHLMAVTFSDSHPLHNTVMSVLDVRRHRDFSLTVPIEGLDGIIDAELAYIAALWPKL